MRMLRWTWWALAGAVAVVVVTPAHAQQVEIKPTTKVKRDKYVITAAEIAERQDLTNAYDAVKLLRPDYLKTTRARSGILGSGATGGYPPDVVGRPPGGGTTTYPPTSTGDARAGADRGEGGAYGSSSGGAAATLAVLYIDEVKQQTLEEMKNIRAAEIFEIRYMTGNQAAVRYGAGYEGGAILLKTNRTAKP